ncbi:MULTISPECIES: 23S rRNA (guanosine(2251)-2'-O)-methyltransferase RlmB [unclassified Campylobacter]|uniref:23S rRNA (guanosine(2251)-2'-O)-methyltransferase RlmB n=1 Tax=unclassified Campylobacter TaxID=2593542 RepID=UPI001237C162|nr:MULTISPECIES: 23S rRNA (guanosine(2251)-2'-O)-methyltransferase RlmB [unclassified Campylobacter]KAA6225218.1 23S rRNA (guanosine(2251)-2'-O)-methyltransferase RlmB [Campylobacter sp. LR196d]KAA6226229.1 23S rRNA (guanosine(2251)-2'-O)-methyltransferase RlmB [Campylobacter sp. LR185c]KAA6228970.1 23S rRNA (guanosine(2251)-2'-O)-methyltransferase RlmB [Campylobacter sp. LR286c]KAA6231643.1 23S rRNA (guanosine(2251)-2'-O)-methyltransferase RlmB [Campylobacter sp. LR291e]KAA8604727.1 23S rRNA 
MLVYGKQVFFYILNNHKHLVNELFLAKECDKKTFAQIVNFGFKINKLDFKTAQSYARGGNHQGFLLDIKDYEFTHFNEIKKSEFLVMLCGISDVGNIGAIARTAYALGVDGLVVVGEKLTMQGIVRTSSGAALGLNIALIKDALSALNELKQLNFHIYASDINGQDIHKMHFGHKKKVLILGSEGFGLSHKIIKQCDECVGIKMSHNFDSLNVSAAFAILCDRIRDA